MDAVYVRRFTKLNQQMQRPARVAVCLITKL
jgi:hypothetical protein